jgi:hypothetical protein
MAPPCHPLLAAAVLSGAVGRPCHDERPRLGERKKKCFGDLDLDHSNPNRRSRLDQDHTPSPDESEPRISKWVALI